VTRSPALTLNFFFAWTMTAAAAGKGVTALKGMADPAVSSFVQLDMKLQNFQSLEFKPVINTASPLLVLKRLLVDRHGRLSELHIYRGHVSAENELLDDAKSLAEYGILGKPKGEVPDTVALCYNFVPYSADDPLLLATHSRDRLGVSL